MGLIEFRQITRNMMILKSGHFERNRPGIESGGRAGFNQSAPAVVLLRVHWVAFFIGSSYP